MKNECEFEVLKTTSKAKFPITEESAVSLPLLAKKLDCLESITTKYDVEANDGGASYVTIKVPDLKISFNVFRNGKIVVWHSLSPKALRFFLDFFYYAVVIECLEDNQ